MIFVSYDTFHKINKSIWVGYQMRRNDNGEIFDISVMKVFCFMIQRGIYI